jgi:hypothetical protein
MKERQWWAGVAVHEEMEVRRKISAANSLFSLISVSFLFPSINLLLIHTISYPTINSCSQRVCVASSLEISAFASFRFFGQIT